MKKFFSARGGSVCDGKNKKTLLQIKRGFSLLEVIVAVFIFSLIMVAVTGTFANFSVSYRNTRATQKDLENAQYAINLMAKVIRTSNVIKCNGGSCSAADYTSISIFDNSQDKCIVYRINNHELQTSSASPETSGDGNTCAFSESYSTITTGYIETGKFYVVPSSAGSIAGRITISFSICQPDSSAASCSANLDDKARIQTSVSLRNYQEVQP